VDCGDFREALSARLDNEDCGPVDAHLESCADCAYWFDAAALITRRTRTSAVVAWPDVADAVLARVPPDRTLPLRLALGGVGVLLCATALMTLVSGVYEAGAWQFAAGVSLVVVPARRWSALALVPLLGVLVAVLSWGQATTGLSPTGVASLTLAAAALALAVLLARVPAPDRPPAGPKPAANRVTPVNGAVVTIDIARPAKTA
jgi:hypothetical protein